jgi:glycosyltransferase involved in cell wall biosynthesis
VLRRKTVTQAPHHHPVITPLVSLLVWAGKRLSSALPLHNSSGLFFFFPFYHTGGAEQVHADIVTCFGTERPLVFFTKRSGDSRFRKQFTASARCFDVGWLLKYTYPFSVGILAGLIGKHPKARVFGCNSLYYYLLLPHLPAHVRVTDLLHALGGGAEQFALPVLDRISERVVISARMRDELVAWYRVNGVGPALENRVTVIPNRVGVPAECPAKSATGPLQVLFVGRGSEEKRINLIGRALRRCGEGGLNIQMTLVGDVAQWLEGGDASHCTLTGPVHDPHQLDRLYARSHLVLITSSREGFPLTIMEGMAHGCVPVCTAVGAIPEHIRHRENGWLLPEEDDEVVVAALHEAIRCLDEDRTVLMSLSAAAYTHAQTYFNGERFCKEYRRVVQG